MSITSSIGLISGIDIEGLVEQLVAIEARPRNLIQQRNVVLQSQQAAFQSINAKLLALKNTTSTLTTASTFNPKVATSSNDGVISVTGSSSALPGNYSFRVNRLVSAQQTITKGFADTNASFIAPTGATFTFESAKARLDSTTGLSRLNGGDGVGRGYIRITDRSGATALIDLTAVVTAEDVVSQINNATTLNVYASVTDEGFILEDLTGQTTSNLVVQNVGTFTTATDLGLVANVAASSITGTRVNNIGENTLLNDLNDGNGVQNKSGVSDFQIALQDGTTFNINLDDAVSLGDVIDAIDTATSSAVTVAINANGTGLELTDTTAGGSTFAITALNSSNAASDLGILQSDDDADGIITGTRTVAAINSKLLRNLNGGAGITTPGTIDITNRSGATTTVDLSTAESISEVIDLINDAGAGVTASLNQAGNGIKIKDNTGSTASNLVVADNSGTSATELNIVADVADDEIDSGNLQYAYITSSTRLDALGVTAGKFFITNSNGVSANVDLTQGNEITIGDVLAEINSRFGDGTIVARINDNGDGILLEDFGSGATTIKVAENGSTTAADLGILGESENPGDNLDGSFEKTVTIGTSDTLQEVVNSINDANIGISAGIVNDGSSATPYRLSLASESSGASAGFVFDDGGLDLQANTLSEAQDAVVFYGSNNPANSLLITSRTNTLDSVIPGASITLNSTSQESVQVTISKDETKIISSVRKLVTDFNGVIATLDQYDSYDEEAEERGLLLGDGTTGTLRSTLFRSFISSNGDLTTQYKSLAQVGITVGPGGTSLVFDESKFSEALNANPDAVENLFTFKETDDDNETIAAGIGVSLNQMLARLTDSESGQVQSRIDVIDQQIALNTERIENLNDILESKRARLLSQFVAMETALAQMQGQSQALAGLQSISAQAQASTRSLNSG